MLERLKGSAMPLMGHLQRTEEQREHSEVKWAHISYVAELRESEEGTKSSRDSRSVREILIIIALTFFESYDIYTCSELVCMTSSLTLQ